MFRLALLLLLPAAAASGAPAPGAPPAHTSVRWLHVDTPLWDIADEGLPVRLTYSLPGGDDPLARLLGAGEARWTVSAGYARVYDSYDSTTRVFKNPGGHAALASAGRQWRWLPPDRTPSLVPALAIELGAHLASRRFPADGTRANVKLITGLEWHLRRGSRHHWTLGVMWLHFSNANLFSRNAGYDGLAVRTGRRL